MESVWVLLRFIDPLNVPGQAPPIVTVNCAVFPSAFPEIVPVKLLETCRVPLNGDMTVKVAVAALTTFCPPFVRVMFPLNVPLNAGSAAIGSESSALSHPASKVATTGVEPTIRVTCPACLSSLPL